MGFVMTFFGIYLLMASVALDKVAANSLPTVDKEKSSTINDWVSVDEDTRIQFQRGFTSITQVNIIS